MRPRVRVPPPAPNATFIKYATSDISGTVFLALRFVVVTIVTTPLLLMNIRRCNRTNVNYAVRGGIFMTVAITTYIIAISLSAASYVSITTLLTPIIFVVYAMRMTNERLTSRSLAGITLAAAGAMAIIVLPVAIKNGSNFVFYPLASLLVLMNCFTFPAALIYYKKANEAGLPMGAVTGISAWITFIVSMLLVQAKGENFSGVTGGVLFAVLYSGIAVVVVARILNILSYEHIGAAATSVLSYLETIVAVLIPVVVLGEHLSVGIVIGGVLILLGVYVVEHRKGPHRRHYALYRHH